MDLEADIEKVAADDWAERRMDAARRLGRLMRRLGPAAVDSPESLNAAMAEALAKCPAERAILSDALKLHATVEINRCRGSENPNAYLPAIAEALAYQTGHPRDLASWAVHTWHDVLAAPLPPKFTERVEPATPPAMTATLASALVVGICSFVSAGMIECVMIRGYGPTILETALADRAWPKAENARSHDRERRCATGPRLLSLAPIGFVLTGGIAGLAAFIAWGLGGGTADKLAVGGGVAALVAAASCGVLNLIAIYSRGGLTLAPPVESVAILVLTAVLTFGVVYPIASGTSLEPWPEDEHPRDPSLYDGVNGFDGESPGRDAD